MPFKKEPLQIAHKPLITKVCAALSLPFSEYNFSNLYLFRKIHAYTLLWIDSERPALLGTSYSKDLFLMPLFQPASWQEIIEIAKSVGASYLFPVSETWGPFPEHYSLTFHEDESDYVFETESLATYRGRHLDGKRNAVRGLVSRHAVTAVPFSEKDISSALEIVNVWEKDMQGERSDADECREAVQLASQLDLEGLIFEVDGKKRGIILGNLLTKDTFAVHFAKVSLPIHGLYPYMFQELAKKILPRFKWMNWEQDLGIETLRQAKKSYHPALLLKKGWLTVQVPGFQNNTSIQTKNT